MTDELFWKKVNKTDSCWLWTGYKKPEGYGRLTRNNKQVYAHRYSYETLKTKIPPGFVLDHLCRTPSCVNPMHLEPVTIKENVMRGVGMAVINSQRSLCKNGHDNWYVYPNGWRRCRTCLTDDGKKWRHSKRGNYIIASV